MRAKSMFVMAMVMAMLQLSSASASQAGSMMDNIESSINSFRQCYMTTAAGDQDLQGEEKKPEEEEEEPDCE